jgi:signal peptidase II
VTIFKKAALIILVLCSCVGCDQATKVVARNHLQSSPTVYVVGDIFLLQYTENTGAFLGMGSRLPEAVRFWLYVVFVAVILAVMLGFVWTSETMTALSILGGSMIVGGGLSNLVDRLMNAGAVVDFMNLGIGNLRTGIFNVADLAIVFGAGIVFLSMLRQPGKPAPEQTANGDAE